MNKSKKENSFFDFVLNLIILTLMISLKRVRTINIFLIIFFNNNIVKVAKRANNKSNLL